MTRIATARWALPALAVLLAACTGAGEPEGSGGRSGPRLGGDILAVGISSGANLQSYDVATNEATPLRVPDGVEVREAFWGPDGRVFAMGVTDDFSRTRLYELGPDRDPSSVGRSIRDGEGRVLSVVGPLVLAAECSGRRPHLLLMDLDGDRRWSDAAPGCAGALNPDGSSLLYARGRTLWEKPLEGGPAEEVRAIDTVWDGDERVATSGGIIDVRYADSAIVAVVPVDGDFHVVVGTEKGPFRVVRLEDYPSQVGVSPQPGGRTIALTQAYGNSRTSALIRFYDPASEETEVVGAGFGGYFEPAWAPDGRVMVASNTAGTWVFIDPAGEWVDVRKVTGLMALDWTE